MSSSAVVVPKRFVTFPSYSAMNWRGFDETMDEANLS
jgi:hypothetical protein